ncbi:transcription/translation regulatory transformer protein RfaH [Kangiella spongicola]|uniref:Transcription antitermination protein RfaH n=1 Tax=Kangiella spongicola TaxID=796379 RepID=A0A318D5H6_9GAMM|nr:transcription/translation regulatory transformer protein RfaH [Kangiella spongicola]PXF63048.1 transcription/translation regulatory transformer protein RfaH [Kangiella spongicola]
MSSDQSAWYLVQCKPRQESRAQENLENQSINSFFPIISLEKIVRGKRKQIEEAMFPGYLFVELLETGEYWSKIRSTRGVRDFVRFGGVPAKISQQLLEQLKVIDHDFVTKVVDSTPKEGDRVRVTAGPFKDLEGIFKMPDGEQRSIVLLNMLGKLTVLEVSNDEFEKI